MVLADAFLEVVIYGFGGGRIHLSRLPRSLSPLPFPFYYLNPLIPALLVPAAQLLRGAPYPGRIAPPQERAIWSEDLSF